MWAWSLHVNQSAAVVLFLFFTFTQHLMQWKLFKVQYPSPKILKYRSKCWVPVSSGTQTATETWVNVFSYFPDQFTENGAAGGQGFTCVWGEGVNNRGRNVGGKCLWEPHGAPCLFFRLKPEHPVCVHRLGGGAGPVWTRMLKVTRQTHTHIHARSLLYQVFQTQGGKMLTHLCPRYNWASVSRYFPPLKTTWG